MSARSLAVGIAAGAVGTAVLNIATYADMALRGRPSSETPSEFVKKLATSLGIEALAAEGEEAENRRSGVGALLGFANGIGVGIAYGAVRPALRDVPAPVAGVLAGAAAMALSDVPLVQSGATDPASWGAAGWIADIVPHLLYGLALAYAFDALDD
ncbi:MAG TPA: hypothetical protein VHS78_01560 [Candidatus Elarobacter sp.]|jgi:hypothetical protein|nr:hypothetical protein [Candidatus Elarobacter sp.]